MELKLEAFETYLNNSENSELIESKLFGVAIIENGDLTETHILEEDFNKYEHINIILDVYPNWEEIINKMEEKHITFPIVVLK
jgi:uncharacterized protein YqfB (UPF0267 family)